MSKVVKCSVVIYDDFNNVLIAERGKGKGVEKVWGLFGKEMKGKETLEKCICKAVDKDIKCTIFELEQYKEYSLDDDQMLQVFKGTIKEYITTHKSINMVKWINKHDLENYNMNELDKSILVDFFNK